MNIETREQRAEGGAWILEQLSLSNPAHERNAARRAMSEVVRAWPGDTKRLWWKWFNEAANSLGLRSKTLDCTVADVVRLAHQGVQIVVYSEGTGEAANKEPLWLAVFGRTKKRFDVSFVNGELEQKSCSSRGLRRSLEAIATDDKLRCVLIPPQHATLSSGGSPKSKKPFERLKQLLKPEWSDIWVVMVFAFVVGLLALATPIAVEALVNTVAFGRFLQPIVILAIILLTFLGFAAAMRGLQTFVVEIIQRRMFARIAGDLAFRLPRAEVEATDPHYVPELTNRFFDVVTVQKVSAQLLLDGIGVILGTFIGMAVLGFYHPWLLGFDLLLLGAIAILVFVLGRGAVSSSIKESKNKYAMAAWLEDISRCPTTFRNDGGAEFAMERADRLIHGYLSARRSHFHILMRQILFALGLQAVASTVLLGLGGWLVVSGELTLGQLVAAELIVTTIVGGVAKFGKHMESFYDLLASVDKLGTLIDLPTERDDGMLSSSRQGPMRLELNSVKYGWRGKPAVLNDTTMTVAEGKSFAVLGAAGSGKSTLLDLVFGTRPVNGGQVLVDGLDPREVRPDVLRSRMALVRNEVFHASIEENVHLHREDVSAADVRDALKAVGLLDTVSRFENGAQVMLTSGGSPLTQNQTKLLSIARAIVGKPGLLMIDGVLDGLPDEDLDRVCQLLLSEERPWTLLIATGREAIAERCEFVQLLNAQTAN